MLKDTGEIHLQLSKCFGSAGPFQTCLLELHTHQAVLQNLDILTKSQLQPSTVPAADKARRDSKQHTDTTGFILAARDLPLISLSYIYCSSWRSEGMPVKGGGGSSCTRVSHCVSEQLPVLIGNVERRGRLSDHVVLWFAGCIKAPRKTEKEKFRSFTF